MYQDQEVLRELQFLSMIYNEIKDTWSAGVVTGILKIDRKSAASASHPQYS